MKNYIVSEDPILIPPKQMPPTILVSAEEHEKLKIKHTCKSGKYSGGTISLPKYMYIPSEYPADYAPTGFKRVSKKSAKIISCPLCGEPINF